jgi:putative membrane protein insertion efficiency factor
VSLATGLAALARGPQHLLIALVRFYRLFFKAWLGNACRFEPSCSAYALQALQVHGAARGGGLTVWRLLRCHPGCAGGLDPVPGLASETRLLRDRDRQPGLFTRLFAKNRP